MRKPKKNLVKKERVPLGKIVRGAEGQQTQSRCALNESVVEDYMEKLGDGVSLGEVVLFFDGERYWIGDGHHRVEAYARRSKSPSVSAEIRPGGLREARLYACGANKTHGLRRTAEDKRKAVAMLLADPEWSGWSNRAVAEHCGVGHPLVAAVRSATGSASSGTVRSATGSDSSCTVRKSADGKERDVSGIANSNAERAAAQREATPRVTRDGQQDIFDDGEPTFQQQEDDDDPVGELEGGAAPADEEDDAPAPAREPGGALEDAEGRPVPQHLHPVWRLGQQIKLVLRAADGFAEAWSGWMDLVAEQVKRLGTNRGMPLRKTGLIEAAFERGGAVSVLRGRIEDLVPHALCDNCAGDGCTVCGDLGWVDESTWRVHRRHQDAYGKQAAE